MVYASNLFAVQKDACPPWVCQTPTGSQQQQHFIIMSLGTHLDDMVAKMDLESPSLTVKAEP